MKLPLANKLKKRMQVEIGMLQDELVDIIYEIENGTVMHGGTSIWRCYGGNRFSEDLDFYIQKKEEFEKIFLNKIKERGLKSLKFKKTDNLIFSKITNGTVEVRVEFNFSAKKSGDAKNYEKMDGSTAIILSLTPEQLLLEKIDAYRNRKFIRDVYDIFYLSNIVERSDELRDRILELLGEMPEPVDEQNLETILYSGAIPSFKQMVSELKRMWSK